MTCTFSKLTAYLLSMLFIDSKEVYLLQAFRVHEQLVRINESIPVLRFAHVVGTTPH